MKRKSISKLTVTIVLTALVFILLGIVLSVYLYTNSGKLAVSYSVDPQLESAIGNYILCALACGALMMLGLGLLLVLPTYILRRSERLRAEAEALRQKNEAMEALSRQMQDLAHHQRLETIGTLTSSIAHEFNNLLTPIMGYSLMALEKLPPEEEALYDDILEIYNASCKAKEIISRLSDLARKNTSTTFRIASPDEIIRKTLDVARPAKPPRVEVKLELNCWDQRIRANEIQLSQLILNLVLNSFHAMQDREGILTLRTTYDENNLQIRVEDTGTGIPDSVLPHIFEPFYTTKETGRGTGLGLAIAAQVVEDHQGKIRVDTREGEGTCFTVTLPRSMDHN